MSDCMALLGRIAGLLLTAAVLAAVVALGKAGVAADQLAVREGPLGRVIRELYLPYPKTGQSYVISNQYVGRRGLARFQVRTLQVHDDVYQDAAIRRSADNGRTWSPFERDPERDIQVRDGYAREPYIFPACYDPQARRMVRMVLLRTHQGDPRVAGYQTYWDHTLYQTSADDGRTWETPRLLKFEEGADYDPNRFGDPNFLSHNRAYSGYNVIALKGGGVATACCITTEVPNETGGKDSVCGVVLCIGRWNRARRAYHWTPSTPVGVTRRISDRGLMEPWVAQLRNGSLFVDMRGNATAANPGRNFYALSTDGGKTLTEARELRFDDGTQFCAPSSLSMLFRHSRTRKLYWFGNLSDRPTSGNSPRYPLYIAEVDEDKPALKRRSLTIIDDYDPERHTPAVQFSNFSVVGDRETHHFELYLTAWGEYPDVYQANVYRYRIKLK